MAIVISCAWIAETARLINAYCPGQEQSRLINPRGDEVVDIINEASSVNW